MTKNPWELFSSMKGWKTASNDLDKAWNIAKKFDTAKEAYYFVEQVQAHYAEFGATDTEPNAELAHRLRKRYGERCEYDPGWTTKVPYVKGM